MSHFDQLLQDLAASPSPYHAVATSAARLEAANFARVNITEPLPSSPGRYYSATGGTLIAWLVPDGEATSFTVVGAHTDSPNLRVRANADVTSAGWSQIGVEVYGGVLLNSWLDRDLGIAGRVLVDSSDGPEARLFLEDEPVLRVPQLAIHLDREIRDTGLKLNPQTQLTPLWATAAEDGDGTAGDGEGPDFAAYVADKLNVEQSAVLSWDLMTFDTQPPAVVGRNRDLLASGRIDNLLSSFCATYALVEAADSVVPGEIPVMVLFDHEEVGSESATGASGSFLANALERIAGSAGLDRAGYLEALTRSYGVSADGAHATHPNYVDKHEPNHHVACNGGVVVKRNANQRYASDAVSEARFRSACAAAEVPVQTYIHRNDLPCGSTIGPITSAQLGVSTVDVGAPQLAMHSAREMAGTADVDHLAAALKAVWTTP